MFMPRACFPFYAGAYMAYLMCDDSRGDSDGASCFFGLAEVRARDIRSDEFLASSVVACLEHLARHQSFYDADVSIYGNFVEHARRALNKLLSQRAGN